MAATPWAVPAGSWVGQTAYILGGGPSLSLVNLADLRAAGGRVIAINNAFEIAPWADIVWTADSRWIRWNDDGLGACVRKGLFLFVTRAENVSAGFPVLKLGWEEREPISRRQDAVAGWCSGGNAINLAYLHGAKRIVLFGYDMRPVGNWHNKHKSVARDGIYAEKFIPYIVRMATELHHDGVEVINATPNSGLKCFPIVHPDEALSPI